MPLFRRDPTRKLTKAYEQKLSEAMQAMRRGDVRENAALVAEAEALKAQIDALNSK
jgi:cell division protein FtsB